MPAPTYVIGTPATAAGSVTPVIPTHQADDILVCLAGCGNSAHAPSMTCTGSAAWNDKGYLKTVSETSAGVGGRVWYWRATGSSETDPTVAGSTNATTAVVIRIRGCPPTDDPFDAIQTVVQEAGVAGSLALPAASLDIADGLVIYFVCDSRDASTDDTFSNWVNGDLASFGEQLDKGNAAGAGICIGVAAGTRAPTGALAAGSVDTPAGTTSKVGWTLVLMPASAAASSGDLAGTLPGMTLTAEGNSETGNTGLLAGTLPGLTLEAHGPIPGVFINDVEVTLYEDPHLSIDDRIEERSTASFVVKDDTGAHVFAQGQRVIMSDEFGTRIFAGYIATVEERRINQDGAMAHAIRCTDNHYKADKRRVAHVYEDMTAEDIVADLILDYLEDEGVTVASALIDTTGVTIGEVIFNYRPLSECFDRLADLANCWWRIDHDDVFHFRLRAAEPAPFTLEGTDIVGTPKYVRNNPMYRNRQYVRGGVGLTDPQTFGPVAGDGVSREWTMGFPLAKVPTILVNSVAATVDLKMRADENVADFYWQKGDPVIVQDTLGTVLGAGDDIEVTYQGEYNIVVRVEDVAAQTVRAAVEGGGSGIVESVDDDASINSRTAGLEKAGALIQKYGIVAEQLEFVTYRSGLVPGMVLPVTLPAHGLNGDELLIESIQTMRHRTSTGYAYQQRVLAVIGPSLGSWAKFFYRIGAPTSFVDRLSVGEASTVEQLHTINETVLIGETVIHTAFACQFPSTSLYPSTTLWPC